MAVRIVRVRSAAEIPVVTPSRASIDSQKAVPKLEVLSGDISGRWRVSQRSAVSARQIRPRPCLAMKLMISGVTFSAAMVRSPSFSRSSSSTRTRMRPLRICSMASGTETNDILHYDVISAAGRSDAELGKGGFHPLRGELVHGATHPLLPPVGDLAEIVARETVFHHLEGSPRVEQQVDGKVHVRGAQPGSVKSQDAQLKCVEHRVGMSERALQNWLPETRVSDDLVGRVGTDLHPVCLRIYQIQLVHGIRRHLPADQAVDVHAEIGGAECLAILLGDAAYLIRIEIHDLVKAVAHRDVPRVGLLEIEQHLVAQRSQARGHDKK